MSDLLTELLILPAVQAQPTECHHEHQPKPKSVRRYCYRCRDCLAVFFVEGDRYRDLQCACGARVECMGRVERDRLVFDQEQCACDGRCTGALGPNCDCKCGGENHGTGRTVIVTIDQGSVPRANNKPDAKRAAEFRAAKQAARERLETRWGGYLQDYRDRKWIPSEKYWAIRRDLERLAHADGLRSHAGRLKCLASVPIQGT